MENVNKAMIETRREKKFRQTLTNYTTPLWYSIAFIKCVSFNDDKGIHNLIRFELVIREDPWHRLMKISWQRKYDSLNFPESKVAFQSETSGADIKSKQHNRVASNEISLSEQMTIKNLKNDENKLNLFLRRHWQLQLPPAFCWIINNVVKAMWQREKKKVYIVGTSN